MNTFCSYYNQNICSSCSLLQVPYNEQIQSKVNKLTNLLSFSLDYQLLEPIASNTINFRNKAKLTITGTVEAPVIGLVGKEEFDNGRDIKDCPLHHPKINELINGLPEFIHKANLSPYQIKSKTGELKGVIAYYSPQSDAMYVRFILRSKESLDRIKKFSSELTNIFPAIKSLSANIQPIPHAILEGEEEIFFNDHPFIPHQIGNVRMKLHPQGFVQTNQDVARQLYSTAAAWVQELKASSFMELFSGQGAFSFFIQKYVERAVGIEINPEAVERANLTAREMKLDHLSFKAMDAGTVAQEVLNFAPDVLLVNPPRRGLGNALDVIKQANCDYFIYSSCSAETLAQDIFKLQDHFKILKAQLFDMFPHTEHFETLALLKSIGGDKKE